MSGIAPVWHLASGEHCKPGELCEHIGQIRRDLRVFEEDEVGPDGFKRRAGLWFFRRDERGQLVRSWLCAPVRVTAVVFDLRDKFVFLRLRCKSMSGEWVEFDISADLHEEDDGRALWDKFMEHDVLVSWPEKGRLRACLSLLKPENMVLRGLEDDIGLHIDGVPNQ